ncbi:uncharacterized protein SPPG_06969 [Spizellomyces punctatus DAOM BR117]|uniref:NDT80 domain-containing protein n=1 Tax=Spizellomyces punctatus (strain DAOM BR117) TaxID=645134 RepID=A0A0L0H8W6_SPIPD|nr:uncharacterized protein SPPG_06969 [Spizellomyces punctatus DAOM BR117]KNC97980.1 hypothetical protein SPPG_06969 [Spizellomyces punctatus DAOM BR117]|eukprot:XP_016606020.1 hypothetical protein SPPG_06969 [Spizellomyces punctatus DAOM BR117]
MAAVSVDQNSLYLQQSSTSPRSLQRPHMPQQQQQQQHQQQHQQHPQSASVPSGHSLPYTSSQAQAQGQTMMGSPTVPMPADYASRKLCIDTAVTRGPYEAAGPSTSYFSLPAMPSPTRRRRGDHMGSFAVSVGPFFKPTKQIYNIYSIDRTRLYTLRINPKVDRGFFLADNDWTCYRRNYFQVSSAFSAADAHGQEVELPCLMEMDNNLYTVTGFALGISARVANGEKKIELVQHTPKRDKGPQLIPQPKVVRSGGNPHQYNGIGTNQLVATFERLQFKTATANNGKRRAAQQYYILIIELFAQTENGQQYKIAMTESAPLVVRGRSPGHYADGNLDALRIFPVDMHFGRRPEFYGPMTSPMSPYGMTSPMYSPVTPGGQMMSPGSPGIPIPSPHYHSHMPGGASMSAPTGPGGLDFVQRGHGGDGSHWNRARAHSLAESDSSFTTTGTNATASSYNSIDFDEIDQSAMGTSAASHHHVPPPVDVQSPPSLSPQSPPSSSATSVSGPGAPIHDLVSPDNRSPHAPDGRRSFHPYSNIPSWVEEAGPRTPITPTTEISKMMGGFHFNQLQQHKYKDDYKEDLMAANPPVPLY